MRLGLGAAASLIVATGGCAIGEDSELGLGSAPGQRCPDVLDYRDQSETPGRQGDYRRSHATIFAAGHSRDPDDGQFARLTALFEETRPTVAFFEGPDRGIRDNSAETIRQTGESGYLRFLARGAGIPARSLEPPPADQVRLLMQQFPTDQVFLFFVLREAARIRDREGKSGADLDAAVSLLLGRVSALAAAESLPTPFSDIGSLQSAFARYWPGRDWRTAETRWFDPRAEDRATGGIFNAAINGADSTNRNRHLLRVLVEAAKAGERPFVVIGGSHVPMVASALDCELRGIARPDRRRDSGRPAQ